MARVLEWSPGGSWQGGTVRGDEPFDGRGATSHGGTGRVEALRLSLRGLRWRAGSSLAVLVVAVIAMGGAALGPLYARSASESLVRDGLATAPPVTTAVQSRGNIAGQTDFKPDQLADAVLARARDPQLDPWYGAPTLALTVLQGSPRIGDRQLGQAQVGWHEGQCGGITVTSGTCPSAPGEAMVSQRLSKDGKVALGTTMQLGITSDVGDDRVKVVGIYDAATADPKVWGLDRPSQFKPAGGNGDGPDTLDEIVVDRSTMARSNGDVAAVSVRFLDASVVHLGDVDDLRTTVTVVTATPDPTAAGPRTLSISGLPDYLDSLQPQLDSVASASFAVTAQLVLLSWFVLFLVIAATSEERSGEIALAKLRGMTPRATLAFGLAEPVLLLLLALPIGFVVAYVVDRFLTGLYLVPGTDVTVSPAAFLALLVCLLGGAAAAALAARGILTAPVLEQLRRTGGRRAKLVRSSAIDAGAVALAAAGIYELKRGGSDALALVAPGLIALAAGLLAVRALPWLARIEVSRTRRSPQVASFLSSRNIARRPSGLRIVVLLSLAVGLAVFAVDGWVVSASNRGDLARAEVGGVTVLHVRAASPGALLSAVEGVDPTGDKAMAALESDNGSGGLLAVDASRVGALAAWDPEWVGSTRTLIGALLHPPQQAASLVVHGKLSLTVAWSPKGGGSPVTLGVAVRAASGLPTEVPMGVLKPGSSTYSVPLPTCVDEPCTLTAFTFVHPVGEPSDLTSGDVVLSGAVDAKGPLDLTSGGLAGWRSGATSIANPIQSGASLTGLSGGQIHVLIEVTHFEDAAIEVADHPVALPVFQGTNYPSAGAETGVAPVVEGLDGRFTPVQLVSSGILPQLLRTGTLADLRLTVLALGTAPNPLDYQVWLSADAPGSTQTALKAAGLDIVSTQSVDGRTAELDRSGTALALRLFLLAALVALVLGAGTLLANSYVVIRRRAYELAALRALGAPRSVLVRAARREQVVLALTGILLGAGAGLGAAAVALPPLIEASAADGPPLWYGPAWLPVLAVLVVVLVLLVVVSDIGARRTVRRALPELLRQVQE